MKKTVTRIIGAALSLVLALGVGIGIGGRKAAIPVEAAGQDNWVQVTSLGGLNTTDTYVIADDAAKGYYMKGTQSGGHFQSAAFDESNPGSATAAGAFKLEAVDAVNNIYKIKLASTSKYVTATAAASGSGDVDGASDTSYGWKFLYASGFNAIYQKAYSGKYAALRCYKNTSWRTYQNNNIDSISTTNGTVFRLYKYQGNQTLTASAESAFTDETITISSNASTTVTWSIVSGSGTTATGAAVTSDGVVSVTGAGTVTVKAVADRYFDATKQVTFSERPTVPFITPETDELEGYTGQHIDVSFTYGNLTGALSVVSDDSDSVSVDTPSCSAGSGTVRLNLLKEDIVTIRFKDGSTELSSLDVYVYQVTLSLNKTSTSIHRGASETLTATHNADDAGGVTWTSSNAKVTVDAGVVSVAYDAVIDSTATITATSEVDSSVSASCTVTVTRDPSWATEFSNTMVANIVLPGSGDTASKYYVVAKITSITNTTYGNGWAVDENGTEFEVYGMYNLNGQMQYNTMYVAQKPLVGDICVLYGVFNKHGDNPRIKNAWVMQKNGVAFEAQALAGVILNRTSLPLTPSDTATLVASPSPADAVLGAVTWTSSDTSVATVNSSGVVTAVSDEGHATITATAGGFSASCVVTVVFSSSLDLTKDPDTATATELTWASGDVFSMRVDQYNATADANNYCPPANTSTRLYKNSKLTVTPGAGFVAAQMEFVATTDGYATAFAASDFGDNAEAAVVDSTHVIVTFLDGSLPFEAVISNTCGFNSATLYYYAAKTTIADDYTSQATLHYNYVKNGEDDFTFSDVAIRFGGLISKTLWDRLDDESEIAGYGVMFSTSTGIENTYKTAMAKPGVDTIDEAIADMVANSGVRNYAKTVLQKPNPDLATNEQKGALEGDYYIWNLYLRIMDSEDGLSSSQIETRLTTAFTAVAYIRIEDQIVFMDEVTASVKSVAYDLIDSGAREADAYDESLMYLAFVGED